LADTNQDLIDTYLAIKENWYAVVKHLHRHQALHTSDHYYHVRNKIPSGRFARAARFIYLNRTCWNGLYRVNLHGHFNVPIGTKTNVFLSNDDFLAVSNILQSTDLRCSDFEEIVDEAQKDDFIYIDPPYTINHGNNGFIKYNDVLFSWHDQERLRDAAVRALNRGAKVLISNACHSAIKALYSDMFEIRVLQRFSVISGKSIGRRRGKEVLILGGYK